MSLNSSHHSYLHLQVTENDSWVKIWHHVDGATLGGPYPVFLSSTVALKGGGVQETEATRDERLLHSFGPKFWQMECRLVQIMPLDGCL